MLLEVRGLPHVFRLIRFPLPGVKFSVLKIRISNYSFFIKVFMAVLLRLLDDWKMVKSMRIIF